MIGFFWPKGGWTRAARYVQYRVARLPDQPHRIARGIFCGAFISFTPFFGLHFILAALMAKIIRGNVVAALLGTAVGNPLTFPAIAVSSLHIGHFLLGNSERRAEAAAQSLPAKFSGAAADLKHNFMAIFTQEQAHWDNLFIFYENVFLPYMLGGLITGLIGGLATYYVTLPFIKVYQKRRKARLMAKWGTLKKKVADDDLKVPSVDPSRQ